MHFPASRTGMITENQSAPHFPLIKEVCALILDSMFGISSVVLAILIVARVAAVLVFSSQSSTSPEQRRLGPGQRARDEIGGKGSIIVCVATARFVVGRR